MNIFIIFDDLGNIYQVIRTNESSYSPPVNSLNIINNPNCLQISITPQNYLVTKDDQGNYIIVLKT